MSTDPESQMTDPLVKRLKRLVSHIEHVQEACRRIADGLIEKGDFETAKALIANAMVHDQSKFFGEEWEFLNDNDWPKKHQSEAEELGFKRALARHVGHNDHHPESAGGIHRMKRVHVLEMTADWHARAAEQGTDLREGIRARAMPRFNFSEKDDVWKTIEEALSHLLEPRMG